MSNALSRLPAFVKSGTELATSSRSASNVLTGTVLPGNRAGATVAARTPRTIEGVAKTIKDVKPTSPFFNKKVTVGGGVVTVSALAGMGADELAEKLASASPEEIQGVMIEADNNGAIEVADAYQEHYNEMQTSGGFASSDNVSFVPSAMLAPSNADASMTAVDNVQRSGLGIDAGSVDRMQVLARAFKSYRSTNTLDDIFMMRILATTATDEDILALEDMAFNGR